MEAEQGTKITDLSKENQVRIGLIASCAWDLYTQDEEEISLAESLDLERDTEHPERYPIKIKDLLEPNEFAVLNTMIYGNATGEGEWHLTADHSWANAYLIGKLLWDLYREFHDSKLIEKWIREEICEWDREESRYADEAMITVNRIWELGLYE